MPVFDGVDALTDDELHALLQTIITRVMKMLTHRAVLVEDMGQTYLAKQDANGEVAPVDIDGRSPAVVAWHDGEIFFLIAASTGKAPKSKTSDTGWVRLKLLISS